MPTINPSRHMTKILPMTKMMGLPMPPTLSISAKTTIIMPTWFRANAPIRTKDTVLDTKDSRISNSSKKFSTIKLPFSLGIQSLRWASHLPSGSWAKMSSRGTTMSSPMYTGLSSSISVSMVPSTATITAQ